MSRTDRTEFDAERPVAPAAVVAEEQIHLEPGVRIAHYELIRELGRGGMGQVFLARDTRLGRRVAMKFLVASSPRFTDRFVVEARATARCNHENIVVIHDVDEYSGVPYMVLEYVEGTTLKKLIADRRLPVGRAIELIVPVVRALAAAHQANIIHRDLKPDNILVTGSGTIKVLDFGIAKLLSSPEAPVQRQRPPSAPPSLPLHATRSGAIVGTLPYMSPEQLGTEPVDHRSDLWAVGIILFEMLAGKHPLDPITEGRLFGAAAMTDEPMPSLGEEVPGLPDKLDQIVARCLAKTKTARYATAAELCAELEPLLPRRAGRHLVTDESPYPGLTAFQESDANRFFGRSQDIAEIVARLRDQPLVGVVGPSGVGKSSLVRAGVVPALKSSGDAWEVMIVRPGRQPLAALASTLDSMRETRDSDPVIDDLAGTLRREPGTFGARLRARARRKRTSILLFVDQHEELYTLVADPGERRAFTACLTAAGDDPSGPLRVVVSMRSDFLDRAAEDRRFVDELTRALVFLQPPSRAGLEAALTQPLTSLGFGFEPGIVEDMLATLEATPGSLPLLQFAAAKLWETRDPRRRVLTRDSYLAMGGVGGALASHADEVFAGLTPPDQLLVRAIFQRLVTPERTRAMVDASELRDLSLEVDRLIAHLVAARLLVVHTRGDSDGSGVELVHESLIKSWPALRRWLDENQDDSAFLAHVRTAAKQWDAKGRPQGLLWRAEAMEEARLWRSRFLGEIPPREADFLDAVIGLATRAARIKHRAVIGTIAFLGLLVAAAGIALVLIASARSEAERQRTEALAAKQQAVASEERAVKAQAREAQERIAAEKSLTDFKEATRLKDEALASVKKTKDKLVTTQTALASKETARAEAARLASERQLALDRKQAADSQKAAEEAKRRGKHTTDLD